MGTMEELVLDPNLLNIAVRKVGKPAEELCLQYGLDHIVALSTNENPLGPSHRAVEAMQQAVCEAHRYPGICEGALRKKISTLMGPAFDEDNVIVGNGSSDILRLLCQAFLYGGGESIICAATFPLYRLYTEMFGGQAALVRARDYAYDLPAMADMIGDRTRLVFVCNPNNPTGLLLSQAQIDEFMGRVPDRVVTVFDEAYREYVEDGDYADVRRYIEEGRNVLVVRTFSKIYGLGGLRVGYGLAKKELVEYLQRGLSAFHVGSVNLIGAAASLEDQDHVRVSKKHNGEEKQYLYREFDRLGLRYLPTQCNFVLVVELGRDIDLLWDALVGRGVVVSNADAFGVPDAIRVTIGAKEENKLLVGALEQALLEIPRS
jgi:histidinol-phosphate aminotransferase